MNITYLDHSGFVVDQGAYAYVFDYWKDPAGVIENLCNQGKRLWFFISHIHHDHYTKEIYTYLPHTEGIVYHEDVPVAHDLEVYCKAHPMDTSNFSVKILPMAVSQVLDQEHMKITMYGSTDAGGSFLVQTPDLSLFHSGDLNWWHWLGDTPDNIEEAKALQEKEFAPLAGLNVDVAFFPVDARLEAAREWGGIEFLRLVKANLFIPMHNNGPRWEPSIYWKALFPAQRLWIPTTVGDTIHEESPL